MDYMKTHGSFLLCILIVVACNKQRDKDELILRQAADVHNEMMKSAHELEEQLDLLEKDSLNASLADSVGVWKELLESWENDIVEVPGNEEHAGHEEGEHHHDHKKVEVTAHQILLIQQELRTRLTQIRQRVEKNRSSQ